VTYLELDDSDEPESDDDDDDDGSEFEGSEASDE
jgi:hypothetical protein